MFMSKNGIILNATGESNEGYCRICDDVTADGVDSEVVDSECPDCNNHALMGVYMALVRGHIKIYESEYLEDED